MADTGITAIKKNRRPRRGWDEHRLQGEGEVGATMMRVFNDKIWIACLIGMGAIIDGGSRRGVEKTIGQGRTRGKDELRKRRRARDPFGPGLCACLGLGQLRLQMRRGVIVTPEHEAGVQGSGAPARGARHVGVGEDDILEEDKETRAMRQSD